MIILDTHVWIWLVTDPGELTRSARDGIKRATQVGVSTMSCWEVAMLVAHKRIILDRSVDVWMAQALAVSNVELCPLTPKIAIASTQLQKFHGDPADCIIVATAKAHHATLATRDAKIRRARVCETLSA